MADELTTTRPLGVPRGIKLFAAPRDQPRARRGTDVVTLVGGAARRGARRRRLPTLRDGAVTCEAAGQPAGLARAAVGVLHRPALARGAGARRRRARAQAGLRRPPGGGGAPARCAPGARCGPPRARLVAGGLECAARPGRRDAVPERQGRRGRGGAHHRLPSPGQAGADLRTLDPPPRGARRGDRRRRHAGRHAGSSPHRARRGGRRPARVRYVGGPPDGRRRGREPRGARRPGAESSRRPSGRSPACSTSVASTTTDDRCS